MLPVILRNHRREGLVLLVGSVVCQFVLSRRVLSPFSIILRKRSSIPLLAGCPMSSYTCFMLAGIELEDYVIGQRWMGKAFPWISFSPFLFSPKNGAKNIDIESLYFGDLPGRNTVFLFSPFSVFEQKCDSHRIKNSKQALTPPVTLSGMSLLKCLDHLAMGTVPFAARSESGQEPLMLAGSLCRE